MITPDIINGIFESCGAVFILLSIIKLHKDRKVRGVNWIHVGFFASWGYWNLYYYPSLGQWFSFIGGIGIMVTNTIWLGQLMYFTWLEKIETHVRVEMEKTIFAYLERTGKTG